MHTELQAPVYRRMTRYVLYPATLIICENWCSHSSAAEDWNPLGYDAVWLDGWSWYLRGLDGLRFQGKMDPSECWKPQTQGHSITSQKTW